MQCHAPKMLKTLKVYDSWLIRPTAQRKIILNLDKNHPLTISKWSMDTLEGKL